jgi:hypothetical protein
MAIATARLGFPGAGDRNRLPRQVFLFTGHLVDAPGRAVPRFPPEIEPAVARRIGETLDALEAGEADLALTQGACGGDLLFSEACLSRRVPLAWLQPFEESEFIGKSVAVAGEPWLRRYQAAKAALRTAPLAAPRELGPLGEGVNPYERCNLWLLASAMVFGGDKVRCICLWDGGGGDGPGGTAHMVAQVKSRGGQVVWLDIRELRSTSRQP